jgi:hypothetical protein
MAFGLENFKLNESMALCEMINETQVKGTSFYIDKDNEDCHGEMMLGMVPPEAPPGGGEQGLFLFSITYDWIPTITQNLRKMDWVLPAYKNSTREKFLARCKRIYEELTREFHNPDKG